MGLLAAYAPLASPAHARMLGTGGLAAVLTLAAALGLRLPSLVAPAFVLLGAEYAGLFLSGGEAIDERAPLYGALLFLVAELAFGALDLRAGKPEPGLRARRIAVLAGLAVTGVVVGTVALAAASVPLEGGVGLEAVGVLAAVMLLTMLGRLART